MGENRNFLIVSNDTTSAFEIYLYFIFNRSAHIEYSPPLTLLNYINTFTGEER